MLDPSQSLAIYMEGKLGAAQGKMGYGLLRFSPNAIACVIDSRHAGKQVGDVVATPRDCPVVASVADARRLGADVLVLGIAPPGGRIPAEWLGDVGRAVALGMCVVNGLHDPLAGRFGPLAKGQWIWDIRREPDDLTIANGRARLLNNTRVVVVGTDMAQGKMTTALLLDRAMRQRGVRSAFLATGQIGIAISGGGVAIDAVRLDYAVGAIEKAVLSLGHAEVVFIEGQGSLLHPASSATLPLLRGACPTHLVLCHRPGLQTLKRLRWVRVPPLGRLVRLYEDVAEVCGAFPRPTTVGIALNTADLDAASAREWVARTEEQTSLPATDVVRFGPEPLVVALVESMASGGGAREAGPQNR